MRSLEDPEVGELLSLDVVAHLATIDSEGYPHVTPIWFLWSDGAFHLTSYTGRPHLGRIMRNPRVGLVIDVEGALRADGERPNKQVRVIGDAKVSDDSNAIWTQRIRAKYIDASIAPGAVGWVPDRERRLITVSPRKITAVASV
ncbi:pyridoxamine 5'-phosphate oxidase family protein [Nocardia sp. NPDC101769]|uniref:pyridoxamine 5'-phosphate oxidase family protein n=1 Tax=Nocardia sp. NPDC101769 TaxID=3364333 RepID=UPI00382B47D9